MTIGKAHPCLSFKKTSKEICKEIKKKLKKEIKKKLKKGNEMSQAGIDNYKAKVCGGFQTNFLSFGLILLCTIFKY